MRTLYVPSHPGRPRERGTLMTYTELRHRWHVARRVRGDACVLCRQPGERLYRLLVLALERGDRVAELCIRARLARA